MAVTGASKFKITMGVECGSRIKENDIGYKSARELRTWVKWYIYTYTHTNPSVKLNLKAAIEKLKYNVKYFVKSVSGNYCNQCCYSKGIAF